MCMKKKYVDAILKTYLWPNIWCGTACLSPAPHPLPHEWSGRCPPWSRAQEPRVGSPHASVKTSEHPASFFESGSRKRRSRWCRTVEKVGESERKKKKGLTDFINKSLWDGKLISLSFLSRSTTRDGKERDWMIKRTRLESQLLSRCTGFLSSQPQDFVVNTPRLMEGVWMWCLTEQVVISFIRFFSSYAYILLVSFIGTPITVCLDFVIL